MIEEFERHLRGTNLSENTISSYLFALRQYSSQYDGITKKNLRAYKVWLIENYKPKTVNLRLRAINCYLESIGKESLKMPFVRVQQKAFLENVISEADYEYFKTCLKRDDELFWYFVIRFLAATGARVSELIQIKVEHIKLGHLDLYSKGGKLRRIYIPKALQNEALSWLNDTFAVSSYSGSTQIGSTSSKTATVLTTATNSAPTISGFTYADSYTTTKNLTGNDQLFVQDYSTLKVTPGTATAKNGASISNYTASCNGLSSSNTTGSALSVGKIAKSGSVTVTLSVTDSRGYTAETSRTVTVIPYTKPKISSVTLRRTNDIEAEMQLKFSGSISAVTVDGTQKNSVVYVRYRYKKTSESSYGSYTSIYSGTTKSGTSFSYSNLELCNLDANSSYDFHLQIQDKLYSLSSLDLYFTVPQGTPLIALRKKKVGINTPEPQAMLDVAGDMRVDGSPLADFVIQQGTSGIWNYRKWKSGTAECWGQYSFTTAISTAWGVLYESGAIALPNFPFTFAEIPHVHISTENSNYAMFVERGSSSSWSTTTNPGKIFAVRPNTVPSATYKISIYAIGKV